MCNVRINNSGIVLRTVEILAKGKFLSCGAVYLFVQIYLVWGIVSIITTTVVLDFIIIEKRNANRIDTAIFATLYVGEPYRNLCNA